MSNGVRTRVAVFFVVWVLGINVSPLRDLQAQSIPSHPRELTFDGLTFDPPEAASHRHELDNGVVM